MRGARRLFTACLAALAALPAFAQTPKPRVVAVAALSDAIAPATLDAFTRDTGVALTLDAFPTPEAVEQALARGAYDVALLAAPALARAAEAGRLARLDPAALAPLDPALTRLAPGGAPFSYSPWGLAFDARRARERLGDRALDSWETALRPDIWKAFADCGVALPDDPAAMLAAAALALKIDPHSRRPADVKRAFDRLTQLRASAKGVVAPLAILADLAAGELCLAPATAADAAQAAARARAAGEDAEIVFVAPREGAPVALDALAILRTAAHPGEAAAFVEFVLRPESAAQATARTRYANAVPASRDKIALDLAQDPALFPDAAALGKLFVPGPMEAAAQAQLSRDWARLKARK